MSDDNEKLLTGNQAAEFLGVKSATLYAYVSRGLVESKPADNGRERYYRLGDLIKLRQAARGFKTAKDNESPTWTGPVIKSAITEIRDDGHRYRSAKAIELALDGHSFELVTELLWGTEARTHAAWKKAKPLAIPKAVRNLATRDCDYMDLIKMVLVVAEMLDPVSRKLSSPDIFDTARRLMVTMSICAGLSNRFDKFIADSQFPTAQTLLAALARSKSRERARALNCALILCADHELNASALAARIAASCDASLYSCLLSALGVFSGSRHGSASARSEDVIASSMKFKTARAWLKDHLKDSERVPGFGSDLYRKGDPRAPVLLEIASQIAGRSPQLQRLFEVVDCVGEQLNLKPNIDMGLTALSIALNLPHGSAATIFTVSRTAGWIAHSIEQRQYGGTIRPRARYIGKV